MTRRCFMKGDRVRVRKNYFNAGRRGTVAGEVETPKRVWVAVIWDDEEDPDLFKLEGLELAPPPSRLDWSDEQIADHPAANLANWTKFAEEWIAPRMVAPQVVKLALRAFVEGYEACKEEQ